MGRFIVFLYGVISYVLFFGTFVYALAFILGIGVPKTLDIGDIVPIAEAVIVDLAVLSIFALQHSIMARPAFKRWWTKIVPQPAERSTYVLLSTAALALLVWQWRPIPGIVWQVDNPQLAAALQVLSFVGATFLFISTFLINHFELFGLQQVTANLLGWKTPAARFKTPGFYRWVRHPIYVGFIVTFWATPVMTQGHLLFAAVTSAYILVGILLEERDLVDQFGEDYRRYKRQVSALVPFWRKS